MALFGLSVALEGVLPFLLLGLGVFLLLFWQLHSSALDAREPPSVRPSIPIIGHLIGMLKHQYKYYRIMSDKHGLPNYTMSIFGSKIYVITSPLLAQAALRSKDLNFETFLTEIAPRPFGLLPESMERAKRGPKDGSGKPFTQALHKVVFEALAPGPALNQMNTKMLSNVAVALNGIGDSTQIESLYTWLQMVFTLATTSSIFGEHDPFSADPNLVPSLWDFDSQFIRLLVGFYPSLFARRGFKGRRAIQSALIKYFDAGYVAGPDVSAIIKGRRDFHRNYGLSEEDVAKIELSVAWVGTTNAIPALYWMLVYVWSDPTLVEDIRQEVSAVITATDESSSRKLTIDISRFNVDCPLLVSVYQEVIRLTNYQVSVRFVQNDMTLTAGNESLLLKKGAVVQLPAGIMHTSKATWGPNAHVFDAKRFLKQAGESKEQEKVKKSAFMPFGGGKHLCPGRHFAFAEILGAVAALVTGFEITNSDGGPIAVRKEISQNFGDATGKPVGSAKEMGVRIVRRKGMETATLNFQS